MAEERKAGVDWKHLKWKMKKGKDCAAPGVAACPCSHPEMPEHHRLMVGKSSQPLSASSASLQWLGMRLVQPPQPAPAKCNRSPGCDQACFMEHRSQPGNPPRWLCSRTSSLVFGGTELRGSAWPGTKQPALAGAGEGQAARQPGQREPAHQQCWRLASLQIGPREPGRVLRLGNACLIKEWLKFGDFIL